MLGVVAIFGYSGCTAVGFVVGASIDARTSDYDTIAGSNAASVEWGKEITLTKKTGEELRGEFLGVGMLADSQYARLYNECREKHKKEFSLPALGDTVSIVTLKPPKEYKAQFLGFDNQYIWVRMRQWWPNRQQIDMGKIDRITDRNGNLIEAGRLINLSSAGEIPALSTLALKTSSDTLHVPTPMVGRIVVLADKNAKWTGLVLGALIDVAIIVATARPGAYGLPGWSWPK
jgi:hypothetical protein